MSDTKAPSSRLCRELTLRCGRLLRAHTDATINDDELFLNVTLTLIHGATCAEPDPPIVDCWFACIARFSPQVKRAFVNWLEREVVVEDYMPSMTCAFVPDTNDVDALEMKRRQLRPHFIALYKLVTE